MQNRTVPRHILNIINEINSHIEHPEYQLALSPAVKNLSIDELISPFTRDNETHSMAEWIALGGNQKILDWLYKRIEQNLENPLHAAIVCSQPKKTIDKLVPTVANKEARDFYGYTPLHLAVIVNNNKMVAMLEVAAKKTKQGLDSIGLRHVANTNKETPFSRAAANGNLELVKKWLVDSMDRKHIPSKEIERSIRSGLLNAIRAGHDEVIDEILNCMPDELIKKVCKDVQGSAITVAAEQHRQHALMTLAGNLISAYIRTRNEEAKKYTTSYNLLLFKAEFGYPDDKKIPAAQALLSVVSGNDTRDKLAAHAGPLGTKRLKEVYDIVKKFYLDVYIPEISNKVCATNRS